MKKILTLALMAAATLSSTVSAQILWKVEKPGNAHVSYILGTHHLAPVAIIDSLENLPAAIKGADRMYGEIEMADIMSPESIAQMQQSLMAPADSTLDKVLTPDQLAQVKAAFDPFTGGQMPVKMLYPLKPAAISTQLAAMLASEVFPTLDPTAGIDNTMQTRAAEAGVPVDGFETMQFQLDMLYGRPIEKQAKGLVKMVGDIEGEKRNTLALSEAYIAHDIDALYRLMLDEEEDPEEFETLIYSRNDNWTKRMLEEMPEASLLVVVGAGHLPGERGLLQQLRDAGYNVTSAE